MRVYVGSSPQTEIARKVLECSIIRRTEMYVDFVHMLGREWEYVTAKLPKDCDEYSLRRWMIPAHMKWEGMAIYLDAACMVTGDIWDLWTMPAQTGTRNQATMWCPHHKGMPQTDVMLLDCAKAKNQWGFSVEDMLKHLRKDRGNFAGFQRGGWLAQEPVKIEDGWLHHDFYQPRHTKLVRYTNTPELPYPWLTTKHPYGQVWEMELAIAMHTGFVPEEIVREACALFGTDPRGIHPDFIRFMPKKQGTGKSKRRKEPEEVTVWE